MEIFARKYYPYLGGQQGVAIQGLPCPHLSEVSVRGYTHPLWSDRSGVRGALRPPPRHKRGSLPCGSRTLAIQKKGADAAGRIVCAFFLYRKDKGVTPRFLVLTVRNTSVYLFSKNWILGVCPVYLYTK